MQKIAKAHGFSLVELMAVAAIVLVLLGISLPMVASFARTYRLSAAARGVAGQLTLARMRAAASFTQARLNVNVTAGTYEIDLCTVKNTATGGCTTFSLDPNSGVQYLLPSDVSFAFGSITAVPAGSGQTTPTETTPIVFNSRGIPVDSNLNPTGNDALYLANGYGQYYAITVYASGKVTLFYWQASSSKWLEM